MGYYYINEIYSKALILELTDQIALLQSQLNNLRGIIKIVLIPTLCWVTPERQRKFNECISGLIIVLKAYL